jgi:hypothetical protein
LRVTLDLGHRRPRPADLANIRSRLAVTDNSRYANVLLVGRGLDWFWATYARDVTNRKPTDILN